MIRSGSGVLRAGYLVTAVLDALVSSNKAYLMLGAATALVTALG